MNYKFTKQLVEAVYDVFDAAKKEGLTDVSMAEILLCMGYTHSYLGYLSKQGTDLYSEFFKIPKTVIDPDYITAKLTGQIH